MELFDPVCSEVEYRVIYGDTDQMGVVYYGNYPRFYEIGRNELLRQLGLTYKEIENMGTILPVSSMKIKYHRPAYYDDLLTIRTSITEIPASRIEFKYEIFNEKGELLNSGETELAFINQSTRRPVRVPEVILNLFNCSSNID